MAIPQIIKNKLKLLSADITPDDLARYLYRQGIRAIPGSISDGLIQVYLRSQGFTINDNRIHGYVYVDLKDNDFFIIPRVISTLVFRFDNRNYPQLEA